MEDRMTSKLVVNTIEADTGISSVSFASSISLSSTSKFFFGAAGIDIGADTNINRPEAGVLGFNINGTEKVRITSDAKVGIGEDPTISQFQVKTAQLGGTAGNTQEVVRLHSPDVSNTTSYRFTNYRTSNGTSHVTSELRFRRHVDSTDMGYFGLGDQYVSIGYGTAEKFRITNTGKVGINLVGSDNTSPVRNLDIADASGAIIRLVSTDDSAGANARVGEIEFYTNDDDAAHVSSNIKAIQDASDAYGRRGALTFGTRSDSGDASEKVRIDHQGRLIIGTTSSTARLLVKGEEATNTLLETTRSSGAFLQLALGASGAGLGYMGVGNQLSTSADTNSLCIRAENDFEICTGGSSRRILVSNSSAATSIGGSNAFNAMLTVQGDVSGGLLSLKAAENSNRLMISGTNSNGCAINLYDDAGAQKGILEATSTHFNIMAPGQTSMSFKTNDGYGTVERAAIDKYGTLKAHGFRRNSGTSNYNYTPLKGGYQGDDLFVGPTSFYQVGHKNSSSSSNYSAHELTMYRSGHWGQYTQCIVYAIQFYYTHGLRIWHIDSGGTITLKHDYGGNTNITSGGQQLVGSGTHSGQNVYKYQITFENGGTYQQVKWFVGHIGGGSNGHIGNSKTVSEADSWFSTRGGGIHLPNLAHESMQGSPFYQF